LHDFQRIEAKTRSRLEREYKVHLRRGKAELLDGTIAEFDTISDDKNVIGEIKASEPRKQGKLRGRVRTKTQFGDFSRDCMKLAAAKEGRERWFVLTDKTVYEEFRNSLYGKAASALGIRIILCPI
jgi:hypothetical protein